MAWRPDYATATELAEFVRITDSLDEAQLSLAVAAASRAIDDATHRQFGLVDAPENRYYTAGWDRLRHRWVVPIDDLMTEVGLLVAYDADDDQTYASTITNYQLRPLNAAADGSPWTEIVVRPGSAVQPGTVEGGVRVTARFGWSAVPDTIKQACLLQASRLLSRRDAPFGVAGSPDAGSEVRLLARLDPDVAVSVTPYRREWGVV